MVTLTNILLAVLIFVVLCIPGVFDRFVTVLLGPMLLIGLGGLVGFVGSLTLFLTSLFNQGVVLAWNSNLLHPLVARVWPSYAQWLHATYGGVPSSLDAVFLIGLASFTAMVVCVSYVKLFPLIRYYYVKTLLRQAA